MAGSRNSRPPAGRRLAGDQTGATAVEFALLAPLLLLLLAGLIDVSRLIGVKLQAQAAAQAGADYARLRGWDAQAVAQAVTAATPLAAAASPAPQLANACVAAGQLTAVPSGPCPDGSPAARIATVSAQAPFKALLPWPGVLMPGVVSAKAVVRLP